MEIKNENNYQAFFPHELMNKYNKTNLTKDDVFELIQDNLLSIENIELQYQKVLELHSENLLPKMRRLDVNYIEIKVNLIFLKKHILLCGYFLQHSIRKELLDKDYHSTLISKEFGDLEAILSTIINDNKTLFPCYFNTISQKVTNTPSYVFQQEENSIVEYINKTVQETQIIINQAIEEEYKPPSIRLLCNFLIIIKEINISSFFKLSYFLNNNDSIFDFKEQKATKNITEKMLYEMLKNNSKLVLINQVLPYILLKPVDIFDDLNNKDWELIKNNHQTHFIASKSSIQSDINRLYDFMSIAIASMKNSFSHNENGLIPILKNTLYMGYYLFNKNDALHQSNEYSINFDLKIALELFSLIENNLVKDITKLSLPKVEYRNRYYITINEGFTVEEMDILMNAFLKESNKESFIIEQEDRINDFIKSKFKNWKISLKFLCALKEDSHHVPKNYFKENSLTENEVKYERKSLLSNDVIDMRKRHSNQSDKINFTNVNEHQGDIIIHVHGGAFVATSSTSHENYLRKWAIQCKVPIISIDYSLSPDVKFPVALNEVYQAYLWIVYFSEININKIILAGDSAGGNLISSLVYLLIITNKRLPDNMFLIYPACCLSVNYINPSFLMAFDDKILPSGLLNHILKAYLGEEVSLTNCFASPIFVDDKILKHMPPCNIYIGSSDVLRDQGLVYASRLLKLGVKCSIHEMMNFPHGFISFDFPVFPNFTIASEKIIYHLKVILDK